MTEKLYELVEALDKDQNPIEREWPEDFRFAGRLDQAIVVEEPEGDLSEDFCDRLGLLAQTAWKDGWIILVPPGTRFLKLREPQVSPEWARVSGFVTTGIRDVRLDPIPCAGMYTLMKDAHYIVEDVEFTVPRLFQTDGASIPRFAWITTGTPFDPKHIRAAVLHDYLYQTNNVTRKKADQIFRKLLRHDDVSAYQAFKMYGALRAFGWVAWRKYRKRQ